MSAALATPHVYPAEERLIGLQLRKRLADSASHRFLTVGANSWTFAEADSIARAWARGMQATGLKRGDHVVLMLTNCAEFIFSWFGNALLGVVTVPIDPRLNASLLEYTLRDAAPRALVVHRSLLPALAELPPELLRACGPLIVVDDSALDAQSGHTNPSPDLAVTPRTWCDMLIEHGPDPEVKIDHREVNMVMYTSGSSGAAKGVIMPHAHVFSSGIIMMRAVDLRPDDSLFSPFPLFHGMASRIGVLPALLLGIPIIIGERFSASAFWEHAADSAASIGLIVPTIPNLLLAQSPGTHDRAHRIRAMFNARPDAAFTARFGVELLESYGMTEISHVISAAYHERRAGSCGKVQAQWDVRLIDEAGQEVPQGEVGQIVARPQAEGLMMLGYLNKPEETAQALHDGWFHTGDFGYFDADGYFYFAGRKAERIRRLGENISAAQIEDVVNGHDAVGECAALPHPAPLGEDDIRLIVVARPEASLKADELFEWLRPRLPRYMLPRYIEICDHLPRTPSGKVAKAGLVAAGLTANIWESPQPARGPSTPAS